MLEDLDELQLASIFVCDRLKKVHLRRRLQLDHIPNLEHEIIPTLDDFLDSNDNSDLSDILDNLSFRYFSSL